MFTLTLDLVDSVLIDTACEEAMRIANQLQVNISFQFNDITVDMQPIHPNCSLDVHNSIAQSRIRAAVNRYFEAFNEG